MELNLRLMDKSDLPDVLKIRNDPDTYKYLHTPKPFSLKECQEWFTASKPVWYVILDSSKTVGYIRTSEWNFADRSIWIGCDISKEHRRKGIAFAAYTKFIEMLKKSHWKTVKLSVLKTNTTAFSLYKKLGFETYEEVENSFHMHLKLNDFTNTKKGIKVIACYFGPRRFNSANENPHDAKDILDMLHFLWKIEQNVDQGYPHDVCFVHNELLPTDPVSNPEYIQKCKDFLNEIDGKPTANGKAIVTHRPNIGLSFGAFDHAYNLFKDDYDFWFFTEDDQVVIKENTYKNALKILHLPKYHTNGFVATVGVNREWGPGANGGCGITTREILKKVTENNFSEYLNRGSLPFYYVQHLSQNTVQTNDDQHLWRGEVMFTKVIHDMGYYLEEHPNEEINMSWKDTRFGGKRTIRCRPYETWMDNHELSFEDIIKKLDTSNKLIPLSQCNCGLVSIDIPLKKELLNGRWIQDNGDVIKICDEETIFNSQIKGTVHVTNDKVEIRWNNNIVYSILREQIVDDVVILDVCDSSGVSYKIKKITT